jgi:cell division protein FtsQ
MTKKRNIKKWTAMALWSLAVLAVSGVLLSAMRGKDNQLCAGAEVTVKGSGENVFVDQAEILAILESKKWQGVQPVKAIDIRQMEDKLKRNPWIKTAELFFDKKQVLHIVVSERTPLLRIIAKNNQSFYLDETGSQLPFTSQYTARVPVFTGFPIRTVWNGDDSLLAAQAVAMAQYIQASAFWSAQVQQINIVKEQHFELVPTLGNHLIFFGDTSLMANKFDRLHLFYKKVGAVAGLDRYGVLNVQFAGQIVALKRGQQAISIDTARASAAINHFLAGDGAADNINVPPVANQNADTAAVRRDTVRRAAPQPSARQAPLQLSVRRPTTARPTTAAPKPPQPSVRRAPPQSSVRRPTTAAPRQRPRAVMQRGQ